MGAVSYFVSQRSVHQSSPAIVYYQHFTYSSMLGSFMLKNLSGDEADKRHCLVQPQILPNQALVLTCSSCLL